MCRGTWAALLPQKVLRAKLPKHLLRGLAHHEVYLYLHWNMESVAVTLRELQQGREEGA